MYLMYKFNIKILKMSFEAPLINILGRTRYDLSACNVNGRTVSNWNRVRQKLNLTDDEQSMLLKQFKSQFSVSLKEKVTSSSTILESNKNLNSIAFNDFMRKFIADNKMCNKCNNPELVNGTCIACGFSGKHIDVTTEEISDKKKLTKQEKRALKIKAQLERENNESDHIIIEEQTEKTEV
jgi:hypothetical protein